MQPQPQNQQSKSSANNQHSDKIQSDSQQKNGSVSLTPKQVSKENSQKQLLSIRKQLENQMQIPIVVQLKLYVYGSKESDQFYLPDDKQQTKRPFCLSELQEFKFGQQKIIPNPLFKANIYQIACGALHTVILLTSGQAYTFGCNDQGALGRQGQQCIPIKVDLDQPVDLISAGDNHSLFANSTNGAIYFTGNYNFQRGQKMNDSIFEPVKFFAAQMSSSNRNKTIEKIASGANHSVVLINKKIYCRGQPQSFTVGRRIDNYRRKIKSSLTFESVGLDNVDDVWCGGYHSVAKVYKKDKGYSYWAWGSNGRGQLGINSYQNSPYPVQIQKLRGKNVIKMGGGTHFSQFLMQDGQIWGCGSNQNGNLGLGQDFTYSQHESDLSENQIKYRKRAEEKKKKKEQKEKQSKQRQKQEKEKKQLQRSLQKNLVISSKQRQNQGSNNEKMIDEKIEVEKKQKFNKEIANNQVQAITQKISVNKQIKQKNKQQGQNSHNMSVENYGDQSDNENQDKKVNQQNNLYVKSLRRVQFEQDPEQNIYNITCGSNFSLAWNSKNLYTWGFSMNYVLLNGSQDDDCHKPFKVKEKIINNETIRQVSAGSQHVVYTSYENIQTLANNKSKNKAKVPLVFLDDKVRDRKSLSTYKLSKKRKPQ